MNSKMTHIVVTIEELEKLINDRTFIDNLETRFHDEDFNHLLQYFTNLTKLKLSYWCNRLVDFSKLSDLEYLKFGSRYNLPIDLKNLSKLTKLIFGYEYNQKTDFSKLSNLTCLKFGNRYNQLTDLSNCTNLKRLIFDTHFNEPVNLTNLTNLKHFYVNQCNFSSSIDLPQQPSKLQRINYVKCYNSEIESDYNSDSDC